MVAAGIGFEYQGTNIKPDSRLATVTYLIDELHADVNAKDSKHYTTLHGAAYVGDNAAVRYLVAKGANVKARANTIYGRNSDTDEAVGEGYGRHGGGHGQWAPRVESAVSRNRDPSRQTGLGVFRQLQSCPMRAEDPS